MESMIFFLITPAVSALVQFGLTYFPLPRWVKRVPVILTLAVGGILVGLGMGALLGVTVPREKREEEKP